MGKHITASDYDTFTSDIFDPKIKQEEFVKKPDTSSLVKTSDLNIKFETLAATAELKANKIKLLICRQMV